MKIDAQKLKEAIPIEEYYREELGEPQKNNKDHRVYFCPFHEDHKTPNLAVYFEGGFYCFACEAKGGDVISFHREKHNLSFSDTLKELAEKYAPELIPKNNPKKKQSITNTYYYLDEEGKLLYQAVRYGPKKKFSYRKPKGKNDWEWNIESVRRVLYNLPNILKSDAPIYLGEGEKDCDLLNKEGLTATTNVCGGLSWESEYNQFLKDKDVVVLEDNDEIGRKRGKLISESLFGIASSIKIIRFPDLKKGGDVSDYVDKNSIEDFISLVDTAPLYEGNYARYFGEEDLEDEPNSNQASPIRLGDYSLRGNGFVWYKSTASGEVPTYLTNFTAIIISQIEKDDGAEVVHFFEMEAQLMGNTYKFFVTSAEFSSLNWVVRELGPQAILYPGFGLKDQSRCAIQMFSKNITKRTTYRHLGWRKIKKEWVYLHSEGSIGPKGSRKDKEEVDLEGSRLSEYKFPDPLQGEELIKAIQASLDLFDLAPDIVTFPLFSAVFRAVLGEACILDFSLYLVGPTGSLKTEMTALAQAFFGKGFHGKCLPGNWNSTDNTLEKQSFLIKDGVLVIDDFAPSGSNNDIARLHQKANRILRGQGNNSGRGRMRADGSLRAEYFPRGLILSSGEDVPKGQSIRARALILEMSPGSVNLDKLSLAQTLAAEGVYAQVLSSYIQFLAPKLDELKQTLPKRKNEIRDLVLEELSVHKRTADLVGSLYIGFETYLEFAQESGAISPEQREQLRVRFRKAIVQAAQKQIDHQVNEEPTRVFLDLISASLMNGSAHITDPDGKIPEEPQKWGWRLEQRYGPNGEDNSYWMPSGDHIGWTKDKDLYLEPNASYAAAQKLARNQGTTIPTQSRTLWKRMHEKKLLASRDEARGRNLIRKELQGTRHTVLHLNTDVLTWTTDPNGPIIPLSNENKELEDDPLGRKSEGGSKTSHNIGPNTRRNQDLGTKGPFGPKTQNRTQESFIEGEI